MRLSNPVKFFLASILLSIFLTGCGVWQTNENNAVPPASSTESEFPFATTEPEVFQCEIVVITGTDERKTFIARKNGKYRTDFDFGTENQRSVIKSGGEILLDSRSKTYAEKPSASQSAEGRQERDDYTSLLLNRRDFAEFEPVGSENNLTVYRAVLDQSPLTEVLIYVDPEIGLPVKQEFFSIDGELRTLQYSMELRNFSAAVDDAVFEIPRGFRKVSPDEFYRTAGK